MADEVIQLEGITVVGQRPPSVAQSTGRRDHDAAYENDPPPPAQPKPPVNSAAPPGDDLVLRVAGQEFTGWKNVRLVRGIEEFPSRFALELTERNPDSPKLVSIDPGATCEVLIGRDLLITGYVDSYEASISARGHRVLVTGRSQCEDLVDPAGGVQPGQETHATMTFSAPTLLALATQLCAPFGITVSEPDGEGTPLVSLGDGIPQFTVPLGESVFDILAPYARWLRMLPLDGTDGNLVLAKAGTVKAASGFALPGNCEAASVRFTKQDRFTVYLPAFHAFDSAYDVAAAARLASGNFLAPVPDEGAFKGQPRRDGQARYRPRFVVSDQYMDAINLCEQLAKWQKARDFGRSQAVTVTVSTWRDSAGTLWAPNTLAPLDIPALKLPKLTWIIAGVEFVRGLEGTRAFITLMPPEAFQPEPSTATPFDPQIVQALRAAERSSVVSPASPNFNPRAGERTGGV